MELPPCPSLNDIQAFQLGNLPDASLDAISDHLERCPKCEARARELDARVDPILAPLRQAPRADPALDLDWSRAISLPPAVPARPDYPFLQPAQTANELGRLAGYRVLREIGRGGMGYVFLAEDLILRRKVALKVLKPDVEAVADGVHRFFREGRIMAAVKDPHLIEVYQAGEVNGLVYLAMELLQGEPLGDRLRRGPLGVPEVVTLACKISAGLASIHRHGLVHRDLKPANIWLEEPAGTVKILDFGLARFLQDDQKLTRAGIIVGTPAFMSPEQARGQAVDARSDLFSLGSVLYCMCTGKEPFRASAVTDILAAIAVATPRRVREVNPAIPASLSDLITHLLNKDPRHRPASAAVVVARLEWLRTEIEGKSASSVARLHAPAKDRGRRSPLRQRVRVLAAALVGAAAVAAGWHWWPSTPPPAEPAVVYLSDLQPSASVNWPLPRWPGGEEIDNPYTVISSDGELSPHGLGMHPAFGKPSRVSYPLGGRFQRFQARVSLNDTSDRSDAPVTFVLRGDGKVLWRSVRPVWTRQDAQGCDVDVRGVKELELEVTAPPRAHGAHAIWVEPRLTR